MCPASPEKIISATYCSTIIEMKNAYITINILLSFVVFLKIEPHKRPFNIANITTPIYPKSLKKGYITVYVLVRIGLEIHGRNWDTGSILEILRELDIA